MSLIKIGKNMALAAGALALVVGAARIYAAVSVASTNVPLAIPDNGSVTSTLNFVVAGTITDANLQFSITHTWDSDVTVALTGPGGTPGPVLVVQNCGASADNFTNTVIDDAGAAMNCGFAGAPYTGTFASPVSATAMAGFNTIGSAGVWTLTAGDDSAICTGTLTAWSLTLDGPPPLPVELMDFQVK